MAKKRRKTWKQGYYQPVNPEKYKGNVEQIVFRSSWEESFAKFLDGNKHVIEWASEEFSIPYYHPIKQRKARYFPDFWVRYCDKHGNEKVEVIEIKPSTQVTRPTNGNRRDMEQWIVNMAKWEAAVKFCEKESVLFRVLTERKLFR